MQILRTFHHACCRLIDQNAFDARLLEGFLASYIEIFTPFFLLRHLITYGLRHDARFRTPVIVGSMGNALSSLAN